jgi:hypothetical protein
MKREFQVRFWERAGVKFPRATRQHRLFSFITQNWRGKPLVSYLVIVQLIASTTTDTGLTVACHLDENTYDKCIKVTDAEMAALNIQPNAFRGEWNYTCDLTEASGVSC